MFPRLLSLYRLFNIGIRCRTLDVDSDGLFLLDFLSSCSDVILEILDGTLVFVSHHYFVRGSGDASSSLGFRFLDIVLLAKIGSGCIDLVLCCCNLLLLLSVRIDASLFLLLERSGDSLRVGL